MMLPETCCSNTEETRWIYSIPIKAKPSSASDLASETK